MSFKPVPEPANKWSHPDQPRGVYISLFTGLGGDLTGALWAFQELFNWKPGDGDFRAVGVNHDPKVLAVHAENHSDVEHWDCNIEELDPAQVLMGQEITVLWQSAPCQDWSVAAGGPVKRPHQRATPEWMREWVRVGRPKVVIEENVREVRKKWPGWKKHVEELEGMGYRVEVREPDFADYGLPQNRKRMILIAVRDDQPIAWPKPTHSAVNPKTGKPRVPGTRPHRGAIECLDLTLPCPDIFSRTKWDGPNKKKRRRIPWPYSPMTRNRIARYVREQGTFWEPLATSIEQNAGAVPLATMIQAVPIEQWPPWLQPCGDHLHIWAADPFLARWNRHGYGSPVERPAGVVTAGGNHYGVVQPLHVIDPALLPLTHQDDSNRARNPAKQPAPGVTTAHRGEFAVAEFTLGQQGGATGHPIDTPPATVATAGYIRVGELRCLLPNNDSKGLWRRTRDPENRSVGTIDCSGRWTLAEVGILPTRGLHGGADANPAFPATDPAGTAMAEQTKPRVLEVGLICAEPALVPSHGERDGQDPRLHHGEEPAPTAATCAHPRVVVLQLVYTQNGKANVRDATQSNTTVSTVLRHEFIEVRLEDLHFTVGLRMCHKREIARFQGFPDSYRLIGTDEDINRGLGNAVPPPGAYVFVKAALGRRGMIRSRLGDFPGVAPLQVVA